MSHARTTNGAAVPPGDAANLLRPLQRELARGPISAERAAEWADALARGAPPRAADPARDREAEQSQRLRSQELFDFAPHPCVSTDLMGVVVEANYAAAELFRTRKEFLAGKPLLLYLCERDRSSYYGLLARLRRGAGGASGLPARLQVRPNEQADVLLWTSAVFGEAGGMIGIRWLFRDVSAVTRVEQALREERDFADGLLEAAEAVVLVLDEAGRIVRANSYLRRISDRDDAGLVGSAWHSLLLDEDAPRARRAVSDTLVRGTAATFTAGLPTSAGRLRLIAWTAKAIAHGAGAAALVVGQDITDLQEAREQVARAERLAALGRMMAVQAHESRNLLQRGSACLDRLAWRLEKDSEQLDLLHRAQAALTALGRLYEDVRTVAGPLHIEPALCDLGAVWRDAFADVCAVRPGREAELVEEIDGADLRCRSDAFRLGQVFRNLFENTFDACPGAVRVEVRCRPAPEGDALTVSVRDNGPGLSPEQNGRLFEPFYTTKPRGSGMGMGIAQRIVEAHGGRIAAGADGPGAEFIITIPREQP